MTSSQVMFVVVVNVVVGLGVLLPFTEASRVSYCLRGCGACVDFFGKDLYDGWRCAATCQLSAGESEDEGCGNEMFHLIKRGSTNVRHCKKYCGMCVMRYSKEVYDGLLCLHHCHLTDGVSIDRECGRFGYGKNEVLQGEEHLHGGKPIKGGHGY